MKKKVKKPWPTQDVMNQIYEQHLWGGNAFDFYSGDGSHDPKIVKPYLESVISFFELHNNNLTVCDLGCGDFNIGQHLVTYTKKYIAIDIVENLIKRNKTIFKDERLEFRCLDAAIDQLPSADCILLRQVLQHLSNSEIKNIVDKLKAFKYIILTEHIPIGEFIPNKDIISGQGNRLKYHSGVDVLADPFNLNVIEKSVISSVIPEDNKGQIVTTLFISDKAE
ncbi:class I SAM-dependent methyltransferase [uncultured Psychroserpens sp.]|uniref:class I SAM-dependent methyltransferase n=1 Tax=uncultured Psychroserpens sp. TaxID=255436 RepID=UPI002614D912|nr:class I SAM-dependent methyltransferase [uncultured Psychroserpens sp.]